MSTLTRAETPTHSPWGESNLAGVRASVVRSTVASRASRLQILERRGVLREHHVRRRARPFRDDLGIEHVLVVVADHDVDPGGLLEGGDERFCRLHVLAVVERDRDMAGTGR